MVIGQEFHDIIDNTFNHDVRGLHEGEQLQANCPKCQERDGLTYPDGKYNLEINTAKRIFRCWKCDEPKFSGSLGRLIKTYGSFSDYELYKTYAGVFKNYVWEEDEKEFEVVKLPEEFISFSQMDINNSDHFEAYNYLINDRQLNRDIILKFRLGFCLEGTYGGRIIVPSYDEFGELNYFVGRSYKNYHKIPYKNPKVDKRNFIFNEGNVNWDSTIYLVEGAFDMLSIPFNTIPLLGKSILDALFFKLKTIRPNVVLLLDPDAYKATINNYFKLESIYGDDINKIRLVKLNGNMDIDQIRRNCGHDSLIKNLYSAKKLTTNDYFENKLNDDRYWRRNYR